jgi:cytidylate kinase
MIKKFYITIGRQIGSGGLEVGQKLAKKLNITCYDKQLIEIASQESGLGKEFFEKADERDSHSIFAGMFGLRSSLLPQIYSNYYLSNENLFQIQSEIIKEIAEKESCIFVGRCADYVLKDIPDCLNIYISANKDDRIKRVKELQGFDEEKAEHFTEKIDKKRSAYYNYFSNKDWGVSESYHLCINSSLLGIEKTVEFISEIVKIKFEL